MDISLIKKYFQLSEKEEEQMIKASDLYFELNQNINVVSRKDIDQLVERHFLHSLAIAQFIRFKPGTTILDIGTGGGFPGVPLAILFPEVEFVLNDSIAKKIKVVDTVCEALQLKNVKTVVGRAEKITQKFDFVLSRAVTNFPKFMTFCKKKISAEQKNGLPNGIIYLKGGDFSEELKEYKSAEIHDITDFYEEAFFETKKIIYLPY